MLNQLTKFQCQDIKQNVNNLLDGTEHTAIEHRK